MTKARILVVEDDSLLAREVVHILEDLRYEVAGTASSGEEALQKAVEERPDLVLMDIVLNGSVDGVKAAEHITALFDIPIVYLTAYTDEKTLQRAKITEPYGYILKPFKERELHTNIEIALYTHQIGKKLRESQQKAVEEQAKSEAIIESIGDGFSIQDTDFKIVYMNRIAKDMFGNHVGEYCYKLYEGKDRVCEKCPLAMSFADGKVHRTERRNPTRTLHVEITASPIRDAAGKIIAGIEVARDITKRKQALEALQESEERYRTLFENAHDMIQSVDAEGRFIFVNNSWLKTLGYTSEDIKKMTLFDIIHEDCKDHCLDAFRKVLAGEAVDNIEATFIAKDGRPVTVEGSVNVRSVGGRVIATQGIFRDVTERRKSAAEKERLEAQLLHAQKMEAVGTLTGGIAHEFNNIMTVIMGYCEFLQEGMDSDDPLRRYINMMQSSATRATQLTQSLLAYSRKQIINPRPVNLNEIVLSLGGILSKLIGENIDLKLRPADEDVTIWADSGQIEQVLINLATNARDAMRDGGQLTIETARTTLDNEFKRTHHYVKPGRYASLVISDTGTGMDDKTRERIFEPFFTTKEVGKGTGLGLAMVYGIIKQHEGYIDVFSEPGKGTTFTLYLPLCGAEVGAQKPGSPSPVREGTETVLVAEDDVPVRNLTRQILERAGYTVIVAEDGEDAVDKFLEQKDVVSMLVLDVVMPKKNGKEAYREILKVRPGIKALFLSGYTTDALYKDGILDKGLHFLAKPVSPGKLLTKVRDLLDG